EALVHPRARDLVQVAPHGLPLGGGHVARAVLGEGLADQPEQLAGLGLEVGLADAQVLLRPRGAQLRHPFCVQLGLAIEQRRDEERSFPEHAAPPRRNCPAPPDRKSRPEASGGGTYDTAERPPLGRWATSTDCRREPSSIESD